MKKYLVTMPNGDQTTVQGEKIMIDEGLILVVITENSIMKIMGVIPRDAMIVVCNQELKDDYDEAIDLMKTIVDPSRGNTIRRTFDDQCNAILNAQSFLEKKNEI